MTCPACAEVEANLLSGRYQTGCLECDARFLSKEPAMKNAMTYQGCEENEAAMRKKWPDVEQFRQGRIAVYKWWKRLQEAGWSTR